MTEALIPSLREYRTGWGLTGSRLRALPEGALVMHPGPMNRGVELDAEAADDPRSVITAQVANGVAVRMAVLYLLLGSGTEQPSAGIPDAQQAAEAHQPEAPAARADADAPQQVAEAAREDGEPSLAPSLAEAENARAGVAAGD